MAVESTPRVARRLSSVGFLLAAAALLRVVYLSAYVTQLPFAYGPVGDSLVYLQQARDVLAGRLGSPPLLAFSPLYGYVLAALTSGEAAILPLFIQLAAGVLNIALMYRLTRSLFGEGAGFAAASLMFGYGALLFLESKLLTETLAVTLLLLCLRVYVSPGFRKGRALCCVGTGLVLGLTVLTRASLLFCVPCFVLCALMPWAADDVAGAGRMRRAALLSAGVLAVFGCNGAINLRFAGVFVPVIMVSQTLETATQVQWQGSFDAFSHDGRQASPFDVVEQAARRLQKQPEHEPSLLSRLGGLDLTAIVANLPRKWAMTFSNRETFHEYGFLGERATLGVLRCLPVSFGGIALLAGFGLVALQRAGRLRMLWPLLPAIVGTLVTTALYHPSSRYRLPMVVPLLSLAGWAVAEAWALPRGRLRQITGVTMLTGLALTTVDWFSQGPGNRPAWHLELAVSAYTAGDYGAALRDASLAQKLGTEGSQAHKRAGLVLAGARAQLQRQRSPEGVAAPR